MSEYYKKLQEAGKKSETPTLDTTSEEDPKLYQDAEGGHAKIDTDKGTEGKEGKNKSSIAGKRKASASIDQPKAMGTPQERLEQHLDALFDGEDLSEGFQNKAATIFEAAINERVDSIEEELVEQYQIILEESIEETTKDLVEKLDDYLNYVVEQWMEENSLAVENGIRTDVAENFMLGLKDLFENCYIDVPDEKYDVLGDIAESNESLESSLNESLEENIALRKEIVAHRCGEIFAEEAHNLTDIEVDKLASLVEGVEFEDEEQYREKVTILRESYFDNVPQLTEEYESTSKEFEVESGGSMDVYMGAISRHSKVNKQT